MQIFCLDNSGQTTFETELKGYRTDIYVAINELLYNIVVFDMTRLVQSAESEIQEFGFYPIDANLIIVKSVNKKEIEFTIQKLFENHFFDFIKPISRNGINTPLLKL